MSADAAPRMRRCTSSASATCRPDVLQALQATALHTPVHLYFPDPCREYWVYLRSSASSWRTQADDPEALYYEVGHPLLVALGRIAQDFCLTLDECDAIDERDPLDEAEPLPDATSLLARLQSSIRCLQPELVGAAVREQLADGAMPEALLPALRPTPACACTPATPACANWRC